jgi:NagD protein
MTSTNNYLIDMDGVLVTGKTIIKGANLFIERLKNSNSNFLVLTNNPMYTPGDLSHRLQSIGLDIPPEVIFTSAMATAQFLKSQKPNGKAYVIGESGLTDAIHQIGYVITDINPDYVILGETNTYNYQIITKAIRLIINGAMFIATNPDSSGPSEGGIVPACGAMGALIEKACGVSPFYIGKPNPLMMRKAMNYGGFHSENTTMIGDRMDTDIIAGIMSGLNTILVLSGVTRREDIVRFPYRPAVIKESVAEIYP